MGLFERYLTLRVFLAIGPGVALDNLAPGLFAVIAAAELARVNPVIAVLIRAMVYPMVAGVDPGPLRDKTLYHPRRRWLYCAPQKRLNRQDSKKRETT